MRNNDKSLITPRGEDKMTTYIDIEVNGGSQNRSYRISAFEEGGKKDLKARLSCYKQKMKAIGAPSRESSIDHS